MPKSQKRASPAPAKASDAAKAPVVRPGKGGAKKADVRRTPPKDLAPSKAPVLGKDAAPGKRPAPPMKASNGPRKDGSPRKDGQARDAVPAPVAAAPVVKKVRKGGPTKADLKRYREVLATRLRELSTSSKELAAEALQTSGGEFSVDHMADHGSDNYEQDFNLKLLEGEAEQLTDIRDAIAKIDGTAELPFGLCEACADDERHLCDTCPWIPPTRLDALPHARLCVQMKEREESRQAR
jgi:RNA polymerase-binding transcription factor DksA